MSKRKTPPGTIAKTSPARGRVTEQGPMNPRLAQIARATLGFPTLETRNSDSLDFREVSIWQVREALEQAFAAGVASRGQAK